MKRTTQPVIHDVILRYTICPLYSPHILLHVSVYQQKKSFTKFCFASGYVRSWDLLQWSKNKFQYTWQKKQRRRVVERGARHVRINTVHDFILVNSILMYATWTFDYMSTWINQSNCDWICFHGDLSTAWILSPPTHSCKISFQLFNLLFAAGTLEGLC